MLSLHFELGNGATSLPDVGECLCIPYGKYESIHGWLSLVGGIANLTSLICSVIISQEQGYRAVPYREASWNWRGHEVNYSFAGLNRGEAAKRPPIVAVHGFGGNCHHWRKLTADLCEGYRGAASSQSSNILIQDHLPVWLATAHKRVLHSGVVQFC